jgi:hypothetical protein
MILREFAKSEAFVYMATMKFRMDEKAIKTKQEEEEMKREKKILKWKLHLPERRNWCSALRGIEREMTLKLFRPRFQH